MAVTIDELLIDARRKLAAAPYGPSSREAALLLGHLLGLGEAQILARGELEVDDATSRRFTGLLERRLGGEPFAYLVGEREFYGRPFGVDDRVLIPRPESEHLIDEALALVSADELPAKPRVLDLGTGSGCLAITLALELGGTAVAADLSPAALAMARANAHRHGLATRVTPVASDLTGGLALERFDLVVSNPPYIDTGEVPGISPEILDHEPALALFPPGGGAAFFSRFLTSLAGLRPGVPLLFEIGYRQGPIVAALLQESVFELVAIRPDYAGRDRVISARRR